MPAKRTPKTNLAAGAPAGQLLALSTETNLPGPYVITDTLSVPPPTRHTATVMNDAHQRIVAYGAILASMLSATGDQAASPEQLTEVSDLIKTAENEYETAFLGDHRDAIIAFFDDQPAALWEAFRADVRAHFLPVDPADDKDQRIAELAAALTAIDPHHQVLVGKAPASSN